MLLDQLEFCDYYRVKPIPEVVMVFRFSVPILKVVIASDAGCTALLPVFEVLCYDVRSMDSLAVSHLV